MTIGSPLLALIAGILSILSPCVLPILPVVLGAAASEHRYGPLALATGLSLSFVVLELFLATVGHLIGLDAERLRLVAAVLIITVGAVFLLPPLQARLALAGGPVGNWADSQFGRFQRNTVSSQFWIGALLGAVWSPCVGPTLGAASLLAAQGRDLPQVALIMFAFGVGGGAPAAGAGVGLARDYDAVAEPSTFHRKRNEIRARRAVLDNRRVHRHWTRQADRGQTCRGIAAMAGRPHYTFLASS